MEDGFLNLARRLADQLAGRDSHRSASRWLANGGKFRDRRRRDCRLPYLDRHAGASEIVSLMASLINELPGGECARELQMSPLSSSDSVGTGRVGPREIGIMRGTMR